MSLLCVLRPQPIRASEAADGLRSPVRLTAGSSDQLMGELSPNGRTLYFMSNRNATWQILEQDIDRGSPGILFENDADAIEARVSPDGRSLLYISFKADATGDVCVMPLPRGPGHCLTDASSAESNPFWFPDGKHIGVLSRGSLHGDFELVRIDVETGSRELLSQRNLARPTVSPDGQWLVYVPVTRGTREVGINFSRQAGAGLELLRLDASARTRMLRFDLPGASAFPAFSRDGRYLYFAQYLNDTTFDGRIDGDDNSVLFRIPFKSEAAEPIEPGHAEQLTSAQWNCQYPAPADERLIATCAHQGSLDLYSLPLEGSIPSEWALARLEEQRQTSRNHWERLLILNRMLRLEPDPARASQIVRRMIRLHLELGEYESAEFYTRLTQSLEPKSGAEELHGQAKVLLELIAARRSETRLDRGELNVGFVAEQRERIGRLEALAGLEREASQSGSGIGPLPGAAIASRAAAPTATESASGTSTLALLVISELEDLLGEKALALETFARVNLDRQTDPFLIHLYAKRCQRLYANLNRKSEMLEHLCRLAGHPALSTSERLLYADAFVRELVGSVPRASRDPLIDTWLDKAASGSELELMLKVEGWLAQLHPETQDDVRQGLFELYRENKDFDRRKALVLATVRQAARQDREYLLYEFSNSWVSWVKRAHSERAYAEALYQRVLLERAYVSLADRNFSDARGYFYGVTRQTDSLEAHIGFAEARFLEGKTEAQIEEEYARRYARSPEDPLFHFVLAYLRARKLPELEGDAHERAIDEALDHLQLVQEAMPRSLEVNHLRGYLAHQSFLRSGSSEAAAEANNAYLLALDLARDRPRFRATLLLALGLLQAGIDNHRVALNYFEQRSLIPITDPEQRVALKLARARSLFHIGRLEAAAQQAKEAVLDIEELVEIDSSAGRPSDLTRFYPLALDRAALYHFLAKDYSAAWGYYEKLEPLLHISDGSHSLLPSSEMHRTAPGKMGTLRIRSSAQTGLEPSRNALKLRLMRGATLQKLERHREAVKEFEQLERLLKDSDALWPDAAKVRGKRYVYAREEYELMAAGLEAFSDSALGDYERATQAMERRLEGLEGRFEAQDLDEDLLELAVSHRQLAEYAYRRERWEVARAHLAQGLEFAKQYGERTGSPVTRIKLRLLRDTAELELYHAGDTDCTDHEQEEQEEQEQEKQEQEEQEQEEQEQEEQEQEKQEEQEQRSTEKVNDAHGLASEAPCDRLPLEPVRAELIKELRKSYEYICKNRSPSWTLDRWVLGAYLTKLELREKKEAKP